MPGLNSKVETPEDSRLEPVAYVAGQTALWNESWRDLYDKLGDVIVFYARQEGLNEHSAEDVLQEVMVTVLRAQRGEVAGRDPAKGSFKTWLKGVVYNRIRSVRRKEQKERPLPPPGDADTEDRGSSLPEVSQPAPDFGEIEEQRWRKAIEAAALQRVQARVKPDNFAIFMALLEERVSSEELAKTYHKTTNNIYRIKNSCLALFASEAKARQQDWGRLHQLPS